jgi:hypothetical protein
MEVLTISLQDGDSVKDILQSVRHVSVQKIIFICPRHFSILSDISFLKKLKTVGETEGKHLSFVVYQKFVRDIMKSQDLVVHSVIPTEFLDAPRQDLKTALEKEPATKTQEVPEAEIAVEKEGGEEEPVQFTSQKTKPVFATHKIEQEGIRKPIRGKIFFAFLMVIVLLIGTWAWITPRATVALKLRVSVIPITQNIVVALPGAKIPKEEKFLPKVDGIFVETEVIGIETFPSTGRRYDITDAYGKVTLLNETKYEKFLLPSRLSTLEGAIFRFADKVKIPPRNEKGAGRLVVDIRADQYDENENPIGDRGNIEAGTELFFPALRSESRELYYARANKGPLVGGSTLTHYFIEEGDFEAVEELLIAKFRAQGIDQLRSEIENRSEREKGRYVLLDDPRLLETKVESIEFPEELIGAEVQTFAVPAHVRLLGIVFDQSQVSEFLTEKLTETQDHRKKLLRLDPVSAKYDVMESEALEKYKWVKLSVEMKGVEMLDIHSNSISAREWREKLRKEVAGKTIQEVRGILTNYPEIENVLDIKVSPFWAQNLPTIFDRIEFEIQ